MIKGQSTGSGEEYLCLIGNHVVVWDWPLTFNVSFQSLLLYYNCFGLWWWSAFCWWFELKNKLWEFSFPTASHLNWSGKCGYSWTRLVFTKCSPSMSEGNRLWTGLSGWNVIIVQMVTTTHTFLSDAHCFTYEKRQKQICDNLFFFNVWNRSPKPAVFHTSTHPANRCVNGKLPV